MKRIASESIVVMNKARNSCTKMNMACNQVDLLKNKLGFDEAFNYKEESDLNATLKRLGFNRFVIEKF